jgi:signal peptidase
VPPARGRLLSKAAGAAGSVVLTLILVAAALVFLFLAVGPRFLNYQTSTMLTGSMSPGINPGDVVVSVRTPVSELKVGDVITYSIPIDDHRIETHRVASIKRDDAGATSVTTKGDANAGPDPWTAVLSEDYVYTQSGLVPYLGHGIRALREPLAQSVLLYGASALFVVVVLTAIWRKPR